MNARTELPPLPRKPVYGPAAREEALRLMSEAKREKINFGWSTKTNLCRMANGERPLSYSVWEGAQKYVRQVAGSGSTSRMYRNGLCRSASLPARVPARVSARLTDVSPRPRRQERIVDINAIRRRSPGLGLAPHHGICQTRVSGYAKEGGDIAAPFGLSLLASTQTRRRGPYAGRSMPPWE